MGKLKTEIDKLNPGAVGGGLEKVTQFTSATKTLLDTAKDLLKDSGGNDRRCAGRSMANVVTSLPSLDAIKEELKS